MLRSVGRSSALVGCLLLAACNGNGAPVGTPSAPASQFQQTQSTSTVGGGGGTAPVIFTGLQATEATLNAVLEQINSARSQNGGLPALSRDSALDQCANLNAIAAAQSGPLQGMCGASQVSGMQVQTGADQTAAARSAVTAMVNQGAPPQGQGNDFSNIMSTTFTTVGIGVVTDGNTFVIILFK